MEPGASGASLTATFRTQSVEFTPGEALRRTFTDLKPNTTYSLGVSARLADEVVVDGDDFDDSFGTVRTAEIRLLGYVTNLTPGEWVRYSGIDFGEAGQFDQFDVLHIRDASTNFPEDLSGVGIEVRLDGPNGPLLADIEQVVVGEAESRWRADRADFLTDVSGVHDIYVSVTGANAATWPSAAFG